MVGIADTGNESDRDTGESDFFINCELSISLSDFAAGLVGGIHRLDSTSSNLSRQ
jgi:hypothetical protein